MSPVIADHIPAELRARAQWLVWRLTPVEGRPKPAKVPLTTTGGHAKTDNPATWTTFDEAVNAYTASLATDKPLSGVGFVFTHDDDYVGIDLDGISWEQAQPMVAGLLPAYVELSQSGSGIHVICKGKLPPGGNRKGPVEVYQHGRYFAITANIIGQPVEKLEDRTEALAALHATHIGGFQEPGQGTGRETSGLTPEEQAVIDRILPTTDGRRLNALFYSGEPNEHKQSEADFDLASILCRATADDELVECLMWQSALKRAKWREHRTYLRGITIRNARVANPVPTTNQTARSFPPLVSFGALTTTQQPPEQGWLVEGIWPEGARGWIAGEPKLGKSWLAMDLSLSIVTGTKFLDTYAVKQRGPVFYLTEESTEYKVLNRFRMLAKGHGLAESLLANDLHLYVRKGVLLTDPEWLAFIRREMERLHPVMVIADPMRRYHLNPENQAHEVAPILDAAAQIQGAGPKPTAFVFVHHMRKVAQANADARPGQQLAGSRDLHAWSDAAIYCVGVRSIHNRLLAEVEFKDEDDNVPPFEIALTYSPSEPKTVKTAVRLAVGKGETLDDLKSDVCLPKVLAFLLTTDPERQSTRSIKANVKGRDEDKASALLQAEREGLVTWEKGSNRAHLYGLTDRGRDVARGTGTTAQADKAEDLPF
jgi:hypothetical protein